MKKISVLIICLHLIAQFTFAQGDKIISPKKLKKDFKELMEAIEGHPSPYLAVPENEFNRHRDSIATLLEKEMTAESFYKLASSVIALMKDGHSALYFHKKWLEKYRKRDGAFPYKMHLTNEGKLYVLKHKNGNESIPGGAEIVKINHITIDSFINKIDPWISYELIPFRNVIIEQNFEKFLILVFGSTKDLILDFKSTSLVETNKVENLSYKNYKKASKKIEERSVKRIKARKPYEYEKLTADIGIIKIYSFNVGSINKYQQFLIKTFKDIRKENINSLIIDVRGNYGGWPRVSSQLFHRITTSYFKTMAKTEMKISKAYRSYFQKRFGGRYTNRVTFDYSDRHGINIKEVLKGDIGSYKTETLAFNEKPQEMENEFRGNVYLLVDRVSYSAASSFAATFMCYQMGIIIGEPTGGTRVFQASNFGDELAHSDITYRISSTVYYTPCYNELYEPVPVDILFKPSVLELKSDLDAQLNFAIRTINKINKRRRENIETNK